MNHSRYQTILVDCEWHPWQYGNCSVTCGGGNRTNSRSKSIEEKYGGTCTENSTFIEECNTKNCPVDCEWQDWQYEDCSATCGGGNRTRNRSKIVEEKYGGLCIGESKYTEECNTQNCPVDCEWQDWQHGVCSVTCGGGNRTNTRTKSVEENHGGMCIGDPKVIEECNTKNCPVDCEWQEWQYGECSVTCGEGTRRKTRSKNVDERDGGVCIGKPIVIEECNEGNCSVDCEWSVWKHGECSVTCGGGNRTHSRSKIIEEKHGGVCVGESKYMEECNTENCPGTVKLTLIQ